MEYLPHFGTTFWQIYDYRRSEHFHALLKFRDMTRDTLHGEKEIQAM